jgi:glyoxylate/hydroxypyruvate reductase A
MFLLYPFGNSAKLQVFADNKGFLLMQPIVFIHSLSHLEQSKWIDLFAKLLPCEKILLSSELSDEQAAKVELAIVANPAPEVLNRFKNLVWIHSLWAGVDAITHYFSKASTTPLGGAKPGLKKLKLVRLKDPQLTQTMAEAILAWSLYLHRDMPAYAAQQQQRKWSQLPVMPAKDIHIGVLGAGELGLSACAILLRHGYQVSCWSRSAKQIPGAAHYAGAEQLSQLIEKVDILICLLPLTAATKGLLNKQILSFLPRGASVINFSRGAIIKHQDLVKLLDSGHIKHAVLDVFEHEPLVSSSPLWQHSQITVLPHISAPTNINTAARVVASNIQHYRDSGQIPEAVDLLRGY